MSQAVRSLGALALMAALAGCALGQVRDVKSLAPAQPPPQAAEDAPASAGELFAAAPEAAAPQPRRKLAELYPALGNVIDLSVAARPQAPIRPIGKITLNFEDADIREVAETILHDLLGVNYVIEPGVTGSVTLRTGRPLTKEDLVPTLEAVLATRGAALVKIGGIYRITAEAAAVRAAAGPRLALLEAPDADAFALRIFPLEFVSALEMRDILAPLLPEGRIVYADQRRNLLIVAGRTDELRLARRTIETFDVNVLAGMSVLIESLENVDVSTLIFELDNVFGSAENGPLAGVVRFIPIERLNAVLVISKQPRYLDEARNWIARLDRTHNAEEKRLFVYYVQNGRAADIAETLNGIFSAAAEGASSGGASPALEYTGELPAASETAAAGVEPGASTRGIVDVRIIADAANNAILALATPAEYEAVEEVLRKLDIAPLQVLIEVSILEVTLRDQLRFGVQYFLDTGGLNLGDDGATVFSSGAAGAITSTFPGFSFNITGGSQAKFILDALSELTEVNVVSTPRVLVLNNQPAVLRVGDQVPIATQVSTSTFTSDPRTVNTIEYRDTGVTLEVLPRVNTGGLVTLEISQEVSDVIQTTTSSLNSPTIQQRKILTTVAVMSGETVVLGGLIRGKNTENKSGIPFLSDLPFVGPLFGAQSFDRNRTELILLITPYAVRSRDEARDVTAELRAKFEAVLELERVGPRRPRRFKRED